MADIAGGSSADSMMTARVEVDVRPALAAAAVVAFSYSSVRSASVFFVILLRQSEDDFAVDGESLEHNVDAVLVQPRARDGHQP
jgi:hypothetical protein